jgi:ankyrin repeat protein/predicted aspartyl protease
MRMQMRSESGRRNVASIAIPTWPLFIVVCFCVPALAQIEPRTLAAIPPAATQPSNGDDASSKDQTLPLLGYRGRLYVAGKVNGGTAIFLLDTGSSITTIDFDVAPKLNLKTFAEKNLNTFEGTQKEGLISLDSLELGPIRRVDVPAFICYPKSLTLGPNQIAIGTIGMDTLKIRPFAINFREMTLTLYAPETFIPPLAAGYPLRMGSETPVARASIEGHDGWFEIDTGYDDTVILTTPFAELNFDLIFDRPHIHYTANWSDRGESLGVHWQSANILGHHLSEENGNYDNTNRLGESEAGLVGMPMFRNSLLTIDMATRQTWCHSLESEPLAILMRRLQDFKQRDLSDPSPLYQAIDVKRVDAVKRLLELGVSPDTTDYRGVSPLMLAAARGQMDIVDVLLKYGAQVDLTSKFYVGHEGQIDLAPSYDGYRALLYAARFGRFDAVKRLLEAGADVNWPATNGRTALFLAAEAGFTDLVALLLDHGARVDPTLPTGETPLLAACSNGNVPVVALLLSHNANANASGQRGTCLSYAAMIASVDCVKLLLEHGADANRSAREGTLPLMAAASVGLPRAAECLRLLLAAGADPSVKTKSRDPSHSGKTAYDIAVERGHIESVELLRESDGPEPSTSPSKP